MNSPFGSSDRHHHRHHHHHRRDRVTACLDRDTLDHPFEQNQVKIFIEGNYRYIIASGIPNRVIDEFRSAIRPQNYCFQIPANPGVAEQITKLGKQPFGVAIDGIPFDPEAAEFWNGDRNSGWQYEALSGKIDFGLDRNNAHVRPNGVYHYHGLPVELAVDLGNDGKRMLLIGYAADGFPIYTQYGYSEPKDVNSRVRSMRSSYRLKQGERPTSPGGQHDGTFVQDYEFVAGAGDLDECNGRFGVTPEYPDGIYHYYVTEEFPFIPRYFRGILNSEFQRYYRPHPPLPPRQHPPRNGMR